MSKPLLVQQVVQQGLEQLLAKTLTDLVRGIRSFKTNPQGEGPYIQGCIQAIRKEVRSATKEVKAMAVLKLAYLQMLGYEMGWAAPDVVEVMSYAKFGLKRVGYLAASVSFNQHTDILIMATNLFRKDVTSSNQYEAGIALNALACVATPDLARDLAPDIVSLLSHSRPYVKKKAIMVLYHIFVEFPDALRPAFPKLKEKLKDDDLSTVAAVVSVLCELARKNPGNYVKLAPTLFNLLTTGAPHAWLQLKLVKLFALLCPVEPRLPKRLVEPLTNIINTTPVMSLLYECINTCTTGLVKHLPIIRLCIQKLRIFIESQDQNQKYLGLFALGNIMEVHPRAVREHKDTVLTCLDDEDESIRLRALDLLTGMVDKKNLADIVERLMTHLSSKAEGHYKTQLISKMIAIAAQRDYKYVTDFEWYIDVLVRLTRVPGNEQGKLIADQFLDVAVRVEAVRRFAVKQMILLLQDQYFYNCQSQIVEVLYAAAWVAGEFGTNKEAVSLVAALLHPQVRNVPGHIQSVCMSAALKVFARVAGSASAGQSGNSDLLGLAPPEPSAPVDEKSVAAMESCLALLDSHLPAFAESEVVEVQERACFSQQVVRVFRSVGNASVALELASLFAQTLNPVHPDAQSVVPVPEGLDLSAQIHEWPEEEKEESMEDYSGGDDVIQTGFGGYQHPGTISAKSNTPSSSAGPVDKRYYLGASPSSSTSGVSVPETEPLDLGGMKIVVKEPRKKQGKKHLKAKIVTELALPAGASPSATSAAAAKKAQDSSKDALSSINLDEDLSESEKKMIQHKTYPGATAASSPAGAPKKVEVPAPVPSETSSEGGKKRKPKKGSKSGAAKAVVASPVQQTVQPPKSADPAAPQIMCGPTEELSAICRVLSDDSNPKLVKVQIALQNRRTTPWAQAVFDFKPNPSVSLVSRSLSNPFAVAANGVAPLLCVFEVKVVSGPILIEGNFCVAPGAPSVAAALRIDSSLLVVPKRIALDELGKKIAKSAALLKSAQATISCKDQKTGLKQISERINVKKVRIDNGAALFYGQTVLEGDVFVHVKRASETSMIVEVKTLDQALSKALVDQAVASVTN